MDIITLYHGSSHIITKPVFGAGKPYNDYGRGFYCTEHAELAGEWACTEGTDGFINCYELDVSGLSVLDLTEESYSVLNWLAILMDNRICRLSSPIEKRGHDYLLEHFLPDYRDTDLMIGYRADDSYFSFARSFISNTISLKQLSYAMSLGKLGIQIVLMSEKAFNRLRFKNYVVADHSLYYPKRKSRDDTAREAFRKELEKEAAGGIYMRDIIQKGMVDPDAFL